LGNGTTTNSNLPGQISSLSDITQISSKGEHSFAIKSDGTLWGWGTNSTGQIGNGTNGINPTPAQPLGACALSGTNEITELAQFRLFPNPSNSSVEINLGKYYSDIEIMIRNIIGQVIFTNHIKSADKLNLQLPIETGLYFIEVATNDGHIEFMKAIKK
jgi:hypothetical protein